LKEIEWAEKYRPKLLKDVLGNVKAVAELRRWAESWEKNKPIKNGVILAGPAGCGKTSSAVALANEFGWSLIELNASDARNMATIRSVATTGALNQTFTEDGEYLTSDTGGRKLIVLDEADSLYEGAAQTSGDDKKDMSDRGGKRAIVETIEKTRQPIILIVNDLYALTKGSGAPLRNTALTIRFNKLREATIAQAIRSIAEKQNIRISPEVIDTLARKAEGDLRAAINDLQSIAIGRTTIGIDAVATVGDRDLKITIFDAIRDVFRGTSTSRIRKTFMSVDETPDNIILWIDENLPLEYKRPDDLVNGFNMLSRADVFLGRIRRRQHYKFYSYSKDLMTAGVASVKLHSYSGWLKYNFPSWLLKMSRTKESRALLNNLSRKIGGHTHQSGNDVKNEMIDTFRYIFKQDNEFAVNMVLELELEKDEIAYLLDDKSQSSRVKSIQEEVKRHREVQLRTEPEKEIVLAGTKNKAVGAVQEDKAEKDGETQEAKTKSQKKKKGKRKQKDLEDDFEQEPKPDADEGDEPDQDSKKREVQKSLFDF